MARRACHSDRSPQRDSVRDSVRPSDFASADREETNSSLIEETRKLLPWPGSPLQPRNAGLHLSMGKRKGTGGRNGFPSSYSQTLSSLEGDLRLRIQSESLKAVPALPWVPEEELSSPSIVPHLPASHLFPLQIVLRDQTSLSSRPSSRHVSSDHLTTNLRIGRR